MLTCVTSADLSLLLSTPDLATPEERLVRKGRSNHVSIQVGKDGAVADFHGKGCGP